MHQKMSKPAQNILGWQLYFRMCTSLEILTLKNFCQTWCSELGDARCPPNDSVSWTVQNTSGAILFKGRRTIQRASELHDLTVRDVASDLTAQLDKIAVTIAARLNEGNACENKVNAFEWEKCCNVTAFRGAIESAKRKTHP